ncbi:hypothetical protein F2Q69_00054030 [Brassica cretica]|uniref:Uncharacterized protein n=1 Tax=Brassica cretica TaxID=69181 RepID=A0A8S9MZL4_BRACR|nr:hypothetical protein F2Q69_00054030 [Brassica cretica]
MLQRHLFRLSSYSVTVIDIRAEPFQSCNASSLSIPTLSKSKDSGSNLCTGMNFTYATSYYDDNAALLSLKNMLSSFQPSPHSVLMSFSSQQPDRGDLVSDVFFNVALHLCRSL